MKACIASQIMRQESRHRCVSVTLMTECVCVANECFWSHEWSCHGSCSGWNQHDYFANTISLHNNNDIAVSLPVGVDGRPA